MQFLPRHNEALDARGYLRTKLQGLYMYRRVRVKTDSTRFSSHVQHPPNIRSHLMGLDISHEAIHFSREPHQEVMTSLRQASSHNSSDKEASR